METILVVARHRNQYYSRSKPDGPVRLGSSPARDFRGINCRSFESGEGILPTPLRTCSSPVAARARSSSCSLSVLETPSGPPNNISVQFKTTATSSPINIDAKVCKKNRAFSEEVDNERLSFSERWAGPTYSNSPPPSSLPIPKFSILPKRSVSLDLPRSAPELEMHHPMAKSAPPSPTRYYTNSTRDITRDIFRSADSATKTLRRILNLDLDD
ncbi:hypothetical protein I3842_08G107900 [Carya illinoinensis]|uniref:Uncharacterized protein n=1 Tax=Carya illinoinensis TaxID=32201 RepID=A0A922EBV3_CARIL|nr:hypothetical protein I3842_08G107900 [Carya illinoinensis]KAG6700334.1 hypothetical protein I3842_08G107900 [Carya illinoinensis]